MFVLRRHLERYGRPVARYSDRPRIFRINPVEPANGTTTPFGHALAGLAIEAIHARTPQAKRARPTRQPDPPGPAGQGVPPARDQRPGGRANAYLPTFMADFNPRFAVTPSAEEDAHRPLLHRPRELDLLLSEQAERTRSKNLTVQHRNVAYQRRHAGPGYRLRGAKVTICAPWPMARSCCSGRAASCLTPPTARGSARRRWKTRRPSTRGSRPPWRGRNPRRPSPPQRL